MRFAWAAACVVGALSGSALADQPTNIDMARRAAMATGEHLDAGRFREALESVDRAETFFHAPTHLLMRGEALEGLGRLMEALETYEALAKESVPPTFPAAFRDAVKEGAARAQKLRATLPRLIVDVQSPASGAELRVDSKVTPLGSDGVIVEPGKHVVALSAPGFERWSKVITIDERGEPVRVVVSLVRNEQEPDVPDEISSGIPMWSVYAAAGVGVLGLAVGSITGVMSLGKVSTLDKECPSGACAGRHQDVIDDASALGTASTVAFVVGGAGVAAAGGLLYFRLTGDDSSAVTSWVSPRGAGVRGHF